MKKAALFFDIDGTILSEETKEIPKSAIEALLEVKKKVICCLLIQEGRCAPFRQN